MRIKDILLESPTDIVARFYKEAGKNYEHYYNPEIIKYQEKTAKYYDEFFEKWFTDSIVPVFTKPVTKAQPEYTNKPKQGKIQSPGYRGLQYTLASAGLPYNHDVQRYRTDPNRAIASQTMDGARNSNGQ